MTAYFSPYIREGIHGESSETMETIALSAVQVLRPILPHESSIIYSFREVGTNYFSFDVKARTSPLSKPLVEFSAEFMFEDKACLIYKIGVHERLQGQGVGRALLSAVVSSSYQQGFTDYDVSTSDAGSYFWACAGFRADEGLLMRQRLHSRIQRLEAFVPERLLAKAADLADGLIERPENLQTIAGLKYQRILRECFATAATQLPCKIPPHITPTLGQALLVGTGWDGSARLSDTSQRGQVFSALGISG